jgi:hypothetical protein
MTEAEYLDLRERHEAGELSLAEAEALAAAISAPDAGAQQDHDI